MNHYSNGTLFLWTMPENFGDLYSLPQPMVTRIKEYLFPDAPVRIDAPDHVALFTYDNGAFVVENYRDQTVSVTVSLAANTPIAEATSGMRLPLAPDVRSKGRTAFQIVLLPHSFRVYRPAR
jgi:hypothetical protein